MLLLALKPCLCQSQPYKPALPMLQLGQPMALGSECVRLNYPSQRNAATLAGACKLGCSCIIF